MYAGSAPTMERYHKTVNDNIPLPQLTTNTAAAAASSSLPALDLLSF